MGSSDEDLRGRTVKAVVHLAIYQTRGSNYCSPFFYVMGRVNKSVTTALTMMVTARQIVLTRRTATRILPVSG